MCSGCLPQVTDKGVFKASIDGTPAGNTTMVRKVNHIKLVLEGDKIPSEAALAACAACSPKWSVLPPTMAS